MCHYSENKNLVCRLSVVGGRGRCFPEPSPAGDIVIQNVALCGSL